MDCRRLGVVIATDTIITSNPPAVAITGSESPVALAGRNVTTEMGLVTGLGFLFSSCKREKISLLVLTLTRPTSNLTLMCHIHEEMIKDRVRTETYRTAILQHQDYIEDKVVVDVGCGTGILSIFCAQAGAKRVYAVDASEIALQANEVVKANNLSETVIVLHGRVEDVEIEEEVDVIISEWMGYMLLYESMLGSVITARDRWLKPGGLILPSSATLYMAPVTHPDRYSESIDFWRNVYGIDISAMLPLAKQCAFEEPSVETINGENVLTWPHVVKHADCYTITIQVLESVTTRFKFQSMMRAPFHGFAFWFDVEFSGPEIYPANSNAPSLQSSSNHSIESRQRRKRANPNEALVLSTALEDPPTHWQQIYPNIDLDSNRSGGRSFVRVSNAMILLENFLMASLVLVLVLVLVRWSPSLPPSIDGCCVVFASEPNCMCKGFHRFLP